MASNAAEPSKDRNNPFYNKILPFLLILLMNQL